MPEDCQEQSKCCYRKCRRRASVVLLILVLPLAGLAWVARGTGLGVNDMRSYLALQIEPPTSPRKLKRATSQPSPTERDWHPAVLKAMLNFNSLNLQLTGEQINSGGVPKDGISALTEPQTAAVAQAQDMADHERVIGIVINGKARAYPFSILNRHEVINDVLAGVPIGVIFCPLCDSASVVDRRIDGRTLEFGISGLLSNSNVLLYDRSDHALWSQVWMRPISGPLVGKTLKHLNNWQIARFDAFKALYPDATYVTKKTGHAIDYDRDPYQRYFSSDRLIFPVEPEDHRYPNKTRMVGIELGDITRAYILDEVVASIAQSDNGVLTDTLNGEQLQLAFDQDKQQVRVIQSPAEAKVIHTFWFAWAAFHPDTQVYGQ